ncbi:NgoMIV family type II restriction endonuclease [Nocardia brasiliensis]|uniref:NgoMIV family type II restriction endonuclease n=1 Tax=Nocardia brasiliensis TaxID=37326 RepID=UPI0009DFBD84|nr:NgoMIV family type II restriction endonuclease [Nocardia brasiliensis]
MTAPFAAALCGYRTNGNPSTSDNHDKGSIVWGHAVFQALGVAFTKPEIPNVGIKMEEEVTRHLSSVRPDLVFQRSQPALAFEQYKHLDVFRTFSSSYRTPTGELGLALQDLANLEQSPMLIAIQKLIRIAEKNVAANHDLVARLKETMPEESMLQIDITVRGPDPADRLLVGLSSKWSLRTDRAQDCVSQGSKLVNMRRGHMPHYAVLTMEPRPNMLKHIAYGSGAVDCIYHLALPELRAAAKDIEVQRGIAWEPRGQLERMVAQRRIRPYQDLVEEVMRLPMY